MATPLPRPVQTTPSEVTRLTVELPTADRDTIVSVILTPYILSTICQLALRETAQVIRSKQLTYANQRAFIEYVCKRTYSEFTEKAGAPDDAGRTESRTRRS